MVNLKQVGAPNLDFGLYFSMRRMLGPSACKKLVELKLAKASY